MKARFNPEEFTEIFNGFTINENKLYSTGDPHDAIEYVNRVYYYDMLKNITAVDMQENGIELTYHLFSTENEEDLLISTTVSEEISTVTDIYKSAIADENEIYDMFGIRFINNDNLRRLYMPEDWEGYPLKKDYIQDDTRLAWNDKNNV